MIIQPISSSIKPAIPVAYSSPTGNSAFGRNQTDHDTRDLRDPRLAVGSQAGARKVLASDEAKEVARLQKRDTDVRAHEQAHISAGGGLIRGGASFKYQSGPDGKNYAVGGEVQIELSAGKTASETAAKARQARAAALAPANPSAQDKAVAAQAARMEQQAVSRQNESVKNPDSSSKETVADSISKKIDPTPLPTVSNDRELARRGPDEPARAGEKAGPEAKEIREQAKPLSSDPILDRLLRESRDEVVNVNPTSVAAREKISESDRQENTARGLADAVKISDDNKARETDLTDEQNKAAERLKETADEEYKAAELRSEEARRRFLEDPIISWLLGDKAREPVKVPEAGFSPYDSAVTGFRKPLEIGPPGSVFKADA